jgi:hypothetical protein
MYFKGAAVARAASITSDDVADRALAPAKLFKQQPMIDKSGQVLLTEVEEAVAVYVYLRGVSDPTHG